MRWHRVEGLPVSIDGAVPPLDPAEVARSVERRAVPLLWVKPAGLAPAGTGMLIDADGALLLLTAAHVLEMVTRPGDLAVPLADGHGLVRLAAARRLLIDPAADLALVVLPGDRESARLRRHWATVPVGLGTAEPDPGGTGPEAIAVSGYPAERSCWSEGVLHAKPLTFFARTLPAESEPDALIAFSRTGQRIDGLHIHTPALEGVSGATAWSLHRDPEDDPESPRRLRARPFGIQVSYRHGSFVRCRPWHEVGRMIREAERG